MTELIKIKKKTSTLTHISFRYLAIKFLFNFTTVPTHTHACVYIYILYYMFVILVCRPFLQHRNYPLQNIRRLERPYNFNGTSSPTRPIIRVAYDLRQSEIYTPSTRVYSYCLPNPLEHSILTSLFALPGPLLNVKCTHVYTRRRCTCAKINPFGLFRKQLQTICLTYTYRILRVGFARRFDCCP